MERDYKEEIIEGVKGKVRNLILPIVVLIVVTVFMMIHTGSEALAADGKAFSLLGAFENTTSVFRLCWWFKCGCDVNIIDYS